MATWLLAGFTALALVTALVLLGLDASQTDRYRIAIYVFSAVAVVVYAGTGHVIASRVPRNAIGWVLCLVGLSLAATMMTEQYALRGLVAASGSLPVARLAGWLSEVMFVLTFAPLFFLVVTAIYRILLEFFIVIFRVAEDIRAMRERGDIR